MNNSGPPDALWDENPNTVLMYLRIHQDEMGRVWSVHEFRSAEDEKKTFSWPGGGARQLAYAFLTEALRREAFASVLAGMSGGPEYLNDYKNADDDKKRQIEQKLSQSIQALITNSSLKMGDAIAREILQMVLKQA